MAKDRRDTKKRILNRGEYQRADGRYTYRYIDNEGITRYIYSWTLVATDRTPRGKEPGPCLRELEASITKDLSEGINTYKSNKLTLNDCWKEYITDRCNLKPATKAHYKYMYDRYIRDTLGKKRLCEIKFSMVKRHYNSLIESGLKINTVGLIHNLLHPVFTVAVRDEYIRINPSDGALTEIKRGNNFEKTKRHALTEEQQVALITFLKNNSAYRKWLPLFTFFLGTGCRVGEVLGLRWEDCDFQENVISINHSLIYKPIDDTGKTTFHIVTPKTNAGIREIPMLSAVKNALLEERVRQMKDGFCPDVVDGYSGFIFTGYKNRLIIPRCFNYAITNIVKCYNKRETELAEKERRPPLLLPHFTAHNLRHTFCTRFCENEANLKVIQEIMGHSSIAVTMDIYNEATRKSKRKSFENLESKIKIC